MSEVTGAIAVLADWIKLSGQRRRAIRARRAALGPAIAKLAEYVAAADKQGLQGQPFRNGVTQMLALAKKEANSGLSLPFGPVVVGSSK